MKGSENKFVAGDRVRLKCDYAGRMNRNKPSIDWKKREGVVVQVGRFNDCVIVKWDDRKSNDSWPIGALERVP